MTFKNHIDREKKRLERKRWKNTPTGRASTALAHRRSNETVRIEALKAYCGGELRCRCECGCSESKLVYLDLDHVNDDGAKHRRALYGAAGHCGAKFFKALKRLGWPNDPPLQVLCCKCHTGKHRNGGQCPELGILPLASRKRCATKKPRAKKLEQTPLFDGLDG